MRLGFILWVWIVGSFPTLSHSLQIPSPPTSYTYDSADLLNDSNQSRIETLLREYAHRTSNQILVATFESLEGESLEDFSIRLAEKWKAGKRGRDNGVIVIVFRKEQLVRMEVGYGLEGVLPDALAGRIIREVMVPEFQRGNFDKGIRLAIQTIIQIVSAEQPSQDFENTRVLSEMDLKRLHDKFNLLMGIGLGVILCLFLMDLWRYRRYSKDQRHYRGRYSFVEWWVRFAILFFLVNLIIRALFYAMLFSRGGYYGGRSGFGGFQGGGGSFGGGGASGRW